MPIVTAKGTNTGKALAGDTLTVASVTIVTGASVLVAVCYQNAAVTVTGVTWNGGAMAQLVQRVGAAETTEIWALHNATGATGDAVVTFDLPGGTAAMAVDQVTGLMSTPDDKVASATNTSTSPSSGNTATTSQANEVLYGAIGTLGPSGDAAGTWSNSFTADQRAGTTGGLATTNSTIATGYRAVSATGAYAAAKTGITSREWEACIATFKANADGAVTLADAAAAGDAPASTQAAGEASAAIGVATSAGDAPAPAEAAGAASVAAGEADAVADAPEVFATNGVTLGEATAAADAPSSLSGYVQTSTDGSVIEPPIPAENPVTDPVTGYAASVPDMAARRGAFGVYSKGQAYLAFAEDDDVGYISTLGGFQMRLTLSLYDMPEAFASSDEIHELFSLHEQGVEHRTLASIGVTPAGHIGITTVTSNGNSPIRTLPGTLTADRQAHEIYLDYSAVDGRRRVYLDGVLVLEADGIVNFYEDTPIFNPKPPGYNPRFMLFNGRAGTTKVRCAIHRAYFTSEFPGEFIWPMTDCSSGELACTFTSQIEEPAPGDMTLRPMRYEPPTGATWPLEPEPIQSAYSCLSRPPYRTANIVPANYRRTAVGGGEFDPSEDP